MFYCEKKKAAELPFYSNTKWLHIGECSCIIFIIQLVCVTCAKIPSKKAPLHSQILKQKRLLP